MRCYICDAELKNPRNDPRTGKTAPCDTCQDVINGLIPPEPMREKEFYLIDEANEDWEYLEYKDSLEVDK